MSKGVIIQPVESGKILGPQILKIDGPFDKVMKLAQNGFLISLVFLGGYIVGVAFG